LAIFQKIKTPRHFDEMFLGYRVAEAVETIIGNFEESIFIPSLSRGSQWF